MPRKSALGCTGNRTSAALGYSLAAVAAAVLLLLTPPGALAQESCTTNADCQEFTTSSLTYFCNGTNCIPETTPANETERELWIIPTIVVCVVAGMAVVFAVVALLMKYKDEHRTRDVSQYRAPTPVIPRGITSPMTPPSVALEVQPRPRVNSGDFSDINDHEPANPRLASPPSQPLTFHAQPVHRQPPPMSVEAAANPVAPDMERAENGHRRRSVGVASKLRERREMRNSASRRKQDSPEVRQQYPPTSESESDGSP